MFWIWHSLPEYLQLTAEWSMVFFTKVKNEHLPFSYDRKTYLIYSFNLAFLKFNVFCICTHNYTMHLYSGVIGIIYCASLLFIRVVSFDNYFSVVLKNHVHIFTAQEIEWISNVKKVKFIEWTCAYNFRNISVFIIRDNIWTRPVPKCAKFVSQKYHRDRWNQVKIRAL